MNKIEINPKDFEKKYLKHLNTCFPGWGDKEDYDWVFKRKVGVIDSDIIIIHNDEGEVIAGSGITYRVIKNHNEEKVYIGTMTGSWTLPKARGKGCFTQIINISREICKQKGVPYLTAFVMETNPSYRRLKNEGSSLINSFTLFSPEKFYSDVKCMVKLVDVVDTDLIQYIYKTSNHMIHKSVYFYSFEEFNKQFYDKNKKVEVLKIDDSYALIEESYNVIKLNYISLAVDCDDFTSKISAIANWGLKERSKKLMVFTTEMQTQIKLQDLNFNSLPGYFTVLKTDNLSKLTINNLSIKMGDKM